MTLSPIPNPRPVCVNETKKQIDIAFFFFFSALCSRTEQVHVIGLMFDRHISESFVCVRFFEPSSLFC